MVIVPLIAAGHTRGALTLGRYASRDSYTPADLLLAAFFGIQTAVTLELSDARDVVQRDAHFSRALETGAPHISLEQIWDPNCAG